MYPLKRNNEARTNMKTKILKNSVTLTGSFEEVENISRVATKLIELIDGQSDKKSQLQRGWPLSEITITFSDYYGNDIKSWISIAKA